MLFRRFAVMLAGAAAASAFGQVSVHVPPWTRSGPPLVPGATGWQAETFVIAHNPGTTPRVVRTSLTAIDGPFFAAPAEIVFTLEPGELEIRPAAVFVNSPIGATEATQHIVVVASALTGVGPLPVLGFQARPSSRFVVTPVTPVLDRRSLVGQFTVEFRVERIAAGASDTRTISFAAVGPISTPAPMQVTLAPGGSVVIPVTVTPDPGAGQTAVEFADLIAVYSDDPATPGGPFPHAAATIVLGPQTTPNPDLNGDGAVDGTDLLLLLNAWNPAP